MRQHIVFFWSKHLIAVGALCVGISYHGARASPHGGPWAQTPLGAQALVDGHLSYERTFIKESTKFRGGLIHQILELME